MTYYWYVIMFILGAIIGSFLNVVLYRLHTGRSLNGRSHCMSCGKRLMWYELFPVFSYLAQWGSCRGCRAYIPSRYLLVELLTGSTFLFLWHLFSWNIPLLVLNLLLFMFLIIILVYDIRHTIIPNELTLATLGTACVFLAFEYLRLKDIYLTLSHIGAGMIVSLFFYLLWRVSRGSWIGFGDVKLAFPLGMIVGIGNVFSFIVFSFWVGASISLILIGVHTILKRGKLHLHFLTSRLTIKSEVPFAPFLILGFLLVHLFHADAFDITFSFFFSH